MSQHKVIEYLDLKINFNENQADALSDAIVHFENEFDYIVTTPKIRNSQLRINSMDLVHFLGFVETSAWLPIDLKRFYRDIENQLNQLLMKSLNPDYQYHYKWCLSALKNLPQGRYLENVSSE